DATSYLRFGHVFVANMTGNVVFLGFGIAGATGISVWASLIALGSFLGGSLIGGRIAISAGTNSRRHLATALGIQTVLVASAGAVIGGLLALNVDTAAPLSLATIVLALILVAATLVA